MTSEDIKHQLIINTYNTLLHLQHMSSGLYDLDEISRSQQRGKSILESCLLSVMSDLIADSSKINNFVNAVLKGTDRSLFVDYFVLCVRGKA